jgi:nitric oxide reductase NorQ protein
VSLGSTLASQVNTGASKPKQAPPAPAGGSFTSSGPGAGGSLTLLPVGQVTRPGGQPYIPRTIGGIEDLALLRHWRASKKHLVLYGPPGTGKTAMAEAAFTGPAGQPGLQTIVGGLNTASDDFTGSFAPAPDGSGWEWVPGPLHQALIDDVPLFVDEVFLIDTRVLSSVLYPLMDGRPLRITANPRLAPIVPGPGFFVVAAGNPDVPGAVFSEALRRRFSHHVEVTTDWDLARELGVPRDIITVAKNLDHRRSTGVLSASPQLAHLLDFRDDARELGTAFAAAALLGKMERDDHPVIAQALAAKYGQVTPLALGGRAPKGKKP